MHFIKLTLALGVNLYSGTDTRYMLEHLVINNKGNRRVNKMIAEEKIDIVSQAEVK